MLSKDIHPRGINYTHLMAAFSFHGSPQPIRDLLKDVKEQGIPLHRSMVSELTKAYLNRWGPCKSEETIGGHDTKVCVCS